jgi:hypothetical protein
MPYHFEKGPSWQIFDSFFSGPERIKAKLFVLEALWTQQRFTAFADLVAPGLPPDFVPPTAPFSNDPNFTVTLPSLIEHANRHWFGLPLIGADPTSSNSWGDHVDVDPNDPRTVGFWRDWGGNAEAVLRLTFIRAIEVSLGLDHPTDANGDPIEPTVVPNSADGAIATLYSGHVGPNGPFAPALPVVAAQPASSVSPYFARNWPIEFFWICGVPDFQGSVTWRRGRQPGPADGGRVIVTVLTPGSSHHTVYDDLEKDPMHPPAPLAPSPDGAPHVLDPVSCSDRFGSWTVGHRFWEKRPAGSHEGTHAGQCPCPIPIRVNHGRVMTVQPRYEDGGVLLNTPY